MTEKIKIEGLLPGMNEFIKATNYSRNKGNDLKQEYTTLCALYFKKYCEKKYKNPIFIKFTWLEKNKKRDKDNIAFAKKFILDGMVQAGVIRNDGWAQVTGFSDEFIVDKQKPGVLIEIMEVS